MTAFAQASASTAKTRKQADFRRDVEQRAASVNHKHRLNQVREQEAGHGNSKHRGQRGNFMASIGYGYDD